MSARPLKRIECRKVIVAPYVVRQNRVFFLIVKDRTFKEWTFITGGCKAAEGDYDSALRELCEETKSVVDLAGNHEFAWPSSNRSVSGFRFYTTYREPYQRQKDLARGEYMITAYSMFFIDLSSYRLSPSEIRYKFRLTKNLKGVYNENLDVTFETIDTFLHKSYIWRFIKQVVVRIPKFRDAYAGIVARSLQAAPLPTLPVPRPLVSV